jgi:transcriptional regulator GlxA family with amidase domain
LKHVSILVPRGHASVVNIGGAHQILSLVNDLARGKGRTAVFDVNLVGLERETRQSTGLFSISPERLIGEVTRTDLIILPAIHGDPIEAFDRNREFVPWIKEHYKNGAEVATFCVGAFFLAQTGLLDGKQCATHWMHANQFRALFPDVHLVDDRIMTEEDGVYTSGGAYAFLNLLLYLIEKSAGRDTAILASKAFSIDIDRDSQSAFIIFAGQKDHEDEAVIEAQTFIEEHYDEPIRVDELADRLALSRRTLERRFKSATSNTVSEYVQRVKVEAAKNTLETTRKNIAEVMFNVGYNDTKAFRTVFRRITGLTPVQYRNKYNREAVVA